MAVGGTGVGVGVGVAAGVGVAVGVGVMVGTRVGVGVGIGKFGKVRSVYGWPAMPFLKRLVAGAPL